MTLFDSTWERPFCSFSQRTFSRLSGKHDWAKSGDEAANFWLPAPLTNHDPLLRQECECPHNSKFLNLQSLRTTTFERPPPNNPQPLLKMKYIFSSEQLVIPDNVKIHIRSRIVTVEGPRGTKCPTRTMVFPPHRKTAQAQEKRIMGILD